MGLPALSSKNMDKDFAVPSSIVKIDEHNLLPGSQGETTLNKRNRQRRFHESGSHMRKTVSISPTSVMFIWDIGGGEFLDGLLEITENA